MCSTADMIVTDALPRKAGSSWQQQQQQQQVLGLKHCLACAVSSMLGIAIVRTAAAAAACMR
jgi:hypothetical protein